MRLGTRHWLDAGRIKLYSGVMLGFFLIIAVGFVWFSNLVSSKGYTIVTDFTVFWAVSRLALEGQATGAYFLPNLRLALESIDPAIIGNYGWFYPPSYFLIILPFGLMPLLPAYLVFMLSSLAGYVTVIHSIFWRREALWVLAGFSGIWLTLRFGQNSFLTASLAGAGLLFLERRRPILSGVFIGLLCIKPHLAGLFPLALVAVGAWRTFITAAIVACLSMAVAVSVFGTETMGAWIHGMNIVKEWTETGIMSWTAMPTVFSMLRLLKVPVEPAYIGHTIVAIAAAFTVWKIWRQCDNWPLRSAALVTSTMLISPYLYEYDLVWLVLPAAWLIKLGMTKGWFIGERELLVLVWLMPLLAVVIANHTSIQIAPLVTSAFLWIIFRRVKNTKALGA